LRWRGAARERAGARAPHPLVSLSLAGAARRFSKKKGCAVVVFLWVREQTRAPRFLHEFFFRDAYVLLVGKRALAAAAAAAAHAAE
jgi:hypothetical protein